MSNETHGCDMDGIWIDMVKKILNYLFLNYN